MPFVCSICEEQSTRICVKCTKDTCSNHLCEKCGACSDCCDCEIRLVHDLVHDDAGPYDPDEPKPHPMPDPDPAPEPDPMPRQEIAGPGTRDFSRVLPLEDERD